MNFQLRGKLGVEQPSKSVSARFVWRQRDSGFTIDLWGPLGQGRVRLTGDAHSIAVVDGKGAILSEGDHDEVMRAHLGWTLPLEVLPDWVLGTPSNAALHQHPEYDAAGHLVATSVLVHQRSADAPVTGETGKSRQIWWALVGPHGEQVKMPGRSSQLGRVR